MKGLKRGQSTPRKCLPITYNFLLAILQHLGYTKYEDSVFWVATLVAFFDFLRISELTVDSSLDPKIYQALWDIPLDVMVDTESISIWIKASQTDPFWEGCSVQVDTTHYKLFPVVALMQYMWLWGPVDGSMLIDISDKPFSRGWFQMQLQNLLLRAGVSGDYTSYLLRIGASISAAVLITPDYMIKTMGNWVSDTIMQKIRKF